MIRARRFVPAEVAFGAAKAALPGLARGGADGRFVDQAMQRFVWLDGSTVRDLALRGYAKKPVEEGVVNWK